MSWFHILDQTRRKDFFFHLGVFDDIRAAVFLRNSFRLRGKEDGLRVQVEFQYRSLLNIERAIEKGQQARDYILRGHGYATCLVEKASKGVSDGTSAQILLRKLKRDVQSAGQRLTITSSRTRDVMFGNEEAADCGESAALSKLVAAAGLADLLSVGIGNNNASAAREDVFDVCASQSETAPEGVDAARALEATLNVSVCRLNACLADMDAARAQQTRKARRLKQRSEDTSAELARTEEALTATMARLHRQRARALHPDMADRLKSEFKKAPPWGFVPGGGDAVCSRWKAQTPTTFELLEKAFACLGSVCERRRCVVLCPHCRVLHIH
jgi:hypothetical protein